MYSHSRYINKCIYLYINRKFKDEGNEGEYQLLSVACEGLGKKYEGKTSLPLEYGNVQNPLYLIARLVCCVIRKL